MIARKATSNFPQLMSEMSRFMFAGCTEKAKHPTDVSSRPDGRRDGGRKGRVNRPCHVHYVPYHD
jgi:hypothetical protein